MSLIFVCMINAVFFFTGSVVLAQEVLAKTQELAPTVGKQSLESIIGSDKCKGTGEALSKQWGVYGSNDAEEIIHEWYEEKGYKKSDVWDTRATWLVSSGERSFVCAVLPNSAKVSCAKVLNAPQANHRSKKSILSKKVFLEARAILDGELAFARYHSGGATGGGAGSSTCTDCTDARREFTAAIAACEASGQENSLENLSECGYDDISFCYSYWQTINAIETYFCLMNIPELPAECK